MIEEENQMGLFEAAGMVLEEITEPMQTSPSPVEPTPAPSVQARPAPAAKPTPAPAPAKKPAAAPAKPARKKAAAPPPAAPKKVSGLVPDGDVRLTANIRLDLHLKLKIASAYRRTTIGEILEELIETHL